MAKGDILVVVLVIGLLSVQVAWGPSVVVEAEGTAAALPTPASAGQRAEDDAQPGDEPVVMLGTHHGGVWALKPEAQGGGSAEFHWAWDSRGISADIRSTAVLPHPDGTHDYYAVGAGGGILRLRAGDSGARWIGPAIPGATGWMGYGTGPSGAGGVDVDRVHGDVVCASLGYVGPAALGQPGIYCSYQATAVTPTLQLIDEGWGLVGKLAVIPRPDGFEPERTAVVVGAGDKAWRYRWSNETGKMVWRGPESLPVPNPGHVVISAQLYPRLGDNNRFTLFFTTADVACLISGIGAADCSNGAILYRDFNRLGEPVGPGWRELPRHGIAEGCHIPYNLVWESQVATTARWLANWPAPSSQAIFFSGGAWNAAALGLYTATCLVRVAPGDTADAPYQVVAFSDDNLGSGYQVRSATMAPSPDADEGWRLYVLALRSPSAPEYERILVDFEILYSDDYGQHFTTLTVFENKGQYAFGNLTAAPGWSADGSGARGLYLGAQAVLSTPDGLKREPLPGAYGGNSAMFGSGVTADGIQVACLFVRDGNADEWHSSLHMAAHTVAVGRRHIFFSPWPFSRAPGMMTDGGGLYEVAPSDILEHAAFNDDSIPDLQKVWDPAVHPCQLVVPSNPHLNPPPVAHYIAVDPGEELVFAIMRTAGAGYDFWPTSDRCGDGLWVARRPDQPGEPWTWKLLIKEDNGPVLRHLWVVGDTRGSFRYLVVGLAEETTEHPHLRERYQQPFLRVSRDGAGWTYQEIDAGLPGWVVPTTCRGAGFDYDRVEADYWVLTTACGRQVDSWQNTRSYIRQSDDAGASFVPWGVGAYEGRSLGATVLYRYPSGERRLFVHARDQGVMVQTDSQDPASFALVQDGLGRLSTTAGASALNLMWPPPPPLVTALYLPLVLRNG